MHYVIQEDGARDLVLPPPEWGPLCSPSSRGSASPPISQHFPMPLNYHGRKLAKCGGLKCTGTSHNYIEKMATVWNVGGVCVCVCWGGGREGGASPCILWYLDHCLLNDCSLMPKSHPSQGKWSGEPSRILGLKAHYQMCNPAVLNYLWTSHKACVSDYSTQIGEKVYYVPFAAHGVPIDSFWSLLCHPMSLLPVFWQSTWAREIVCM